MRVATGGGGSLHGRGHAQVLHLWIGEDLVDAVDRPTRDARFVEDVDPVLRRLVLGNLADRRIDGGAIGAAALRRAPLRLGRPLRMTDHRTEAIPHAPTAGGDVDVSVTGGKDTRGNAGRVIVARLAGHFTGDQPAGGLEVQHEQLGFEQTGGHPATDAGPRPFDQGHRDAQGEQRAGHQIVDGHPNAHRSLAGRTGDRHQSAHPLVDLIDGGAVTVRAILAASADSAVDNARIDRAHVVPGDAQPLLDRRAHVLYDDVGRLDQAHERRVPLWRLEVQANRAFVAVQVLEVEAVTRAGGVLGLGWWLDSDDVRAPVGQVADARRASPG